jgi:hypothetical protein
LAVVPSLNSDPPCNSDLGWGTPSGETEKALAVRLQYQ